MKQRIKHQSLAVLAVLLLLAASAGAFIYSGLYNIGADDPHSKAVYTVLQTLRDRSIQARSADLTVLNLEDPQLVLKGAGQYAAMCTQCHLKPGMKNSELRPGLYPQPPNLSQVRIDPKVAFWAIKHGIKMSAMPAWGGSHDDPTIWSMVAFLQKFPDMTPQQYKDMVARAPPDEDMDMGDDEAGGRTRGTHESGDANHDRAPVAAETPLSLEDLRPKAMPAAEAVAQAFHTALQKGDRAGVLALLAPDVTISEGGHTQSRAEYADSHLGEDIAFLKNATVTLSYLGSRPMGDTAIVGSESTIKPITLSSREMLTLRKNGPAWRIAVIHWQSESQTK